MKQQRFVIAVIIAVVAAVSPARAGLVQSTPDPHADPQLDTSIHCDIPIGEGVVRAVNIKHSTVDIMHRPAHSVGFDEMVMTFDVLASVNLEEFSFGERVHFLLKIERGKSDKIAWMCSLEKDEDTHKACMAKLHVEAMKLAAADIDQCSMDSMESTDAAIRSDADDQQTAVEPDHNDHR
ncbi:copper-binding protein [Marinicaulis aureus]|uniref:Copper-binding protein n=1 Tax=Hyphococcus aureus TaxID=2666033 RepID=A0ABW1L379_9PROT